MQKSPTKISVIGAGNVGTAIAQAILTQNVADELVLFDPNFDKADGEVLDLRLAFTLDPLLANMRATSDYTITAASDVCIITPWAQPSPGESSSDLLRKDVLFLRMIVPVLVRFSPNTIFLVVLNPVEILTYVVWRVASNCVSSEFPPNRVIGSGTNLDSYLFRSLIADCFGFNAQHVQAYIIGEQGDRSVAPGSSISVGGIPFLNFFNPQQIACVKESLENIHKEVINSTGKVIRLKGYASWGIGCSVADLVSSILGDQKKIHPVAVLASGFNGYKATDVFMSLPAQLGRLGVIPVTNMHLTDEEARRLNGSAETMRGVQRELGF